MPSGLTRGWVPVFPRDKREAFARRSCANKKIERDDDSKKSHHALGRCGGDETTVAPSPGRHSGHPLERAIERRFGIVTDIGCDRGKAASTVRIRSAASCMRQQVMYSIGAWPNTA